VDVEQDDVDLPSLELEARLLERRRLADRPALELQVDPAQEADRRVVVDDENGMAGRIHAAGQSTRNPS
jgi:hypothetical protein